MKINFTKKEYLLLLNLIEMSDWVLHAHAVGEREETKEYSELIQRILSYAKEMGHSSLVEYDKSLGSYFPTREMEEDSESRKYIDEFESNCFWEELIARLTDQDTLKKAGKSSLAEMEVNERFALLSEAEEKWATEFETHGLARLKVDEGNP